MLTNDGAVRSSTARRADHFEPGPERVETKMSAPWSPGTFALVEPK